MNNKKEVYVLAMQQWLYQCRRNGTELWRYGTRLRFLLPWLWLKLSYLLDSPYAVSRRFQRSIKARDLYVYGETPLTTLEEIAQRSGVTQEDHVYELGSGSGYTTIWLHGIKKCRVTAIEQVSVFAWRLQRTVRRMGLRSIRVCCENYLNTNLDDATVVYLYGSNLEDAVVTELAGHLSSLPAGARVVTVSYPLTDFIAPQTFIIKEQFSARFEWGEADVYVQERV